MAKPDLYICHTAYQVLIDLVRALRSAEKPSLILSAAVPEAEAFRERLEKADAFSEIRVFDEAACPQVAFRGFLAVLLRQHRAEKQMVERTGFSIYPARYDTIYIHNDWSLLGRYLQDIGAQYVLCEDTFASTCWAKHPLLEEQHVLPHFDLRQKTGYGYLYWGDYRGVVAVETEDAAQCPIFANKLRPDSKAALLHSLTDDEKSIVRRVFLTEALPPRAENATILMTHSFVQDGTMEQAVQDAMWQAVVAHYALDGPLFIKAHPRDVCDYGRLFPGAIVLQRTMPSEVLNFALPFRFARALTVQSTVLGSFEAADEKISLSTDEALALPQV